MFDPEFQRKALSLVMGFIMQFSETPAEPEVQELPEPCNGLYHAVFRNSGRTRSAGAFGQ